ncbi:FHA domain-containing protein [Bifidobacterium dentium]|uniref:FHA domain-containing protein n=1 Tax=Bifidobacterium dentium TaxID=1689 RepID=UPI00398D3EFA
MLAVPDHTGTVSRSHARLEITEDHLWITDLGSTNGTKVVNENGEETRLKARQRFPIHTRNRIFLGDMGCSIIMPTSRRKHARER